VTGRYLICLKIRMPPARLERTAPRLGIWCSIHLSYGGMTGFYYLKFFKNQGFYYLCEKTCKFYMAQAIKILILTIKELIIKTLFIR
jgi:hypothetical protein